MAWLPPAVYGGFTYGQTYYGYVSSFPTSPDFDLFDFCYPNDAVMYTIFSFPETTAYRYGPGTGWFTVDNDYCMESADSDLTGFRIDTTVTSGNYSLQFSILPELIPPDFSSLTDQRVFIGVFNQFGKTVGLLLSENDGIALAASGEGPYTVFADSADIFAEGLDYYVFRVTVDESANRANLYVTRKDILTATGVHELRYTFTPLATPAIESDNVRVEVYGTSGDPTRVCLDCLRLSSSNLVANRRPVAVISDDQAVVFGQYSAFDGRGSYDPDTPPAPLTWWWTLTSSPDNSAYKLTGEGETPADASGYTNIVNGPSPSPAGTFSSVLEGDVILGDLGTAMVMRVAADGSWIALDKDVMAASSNPNWVILNQSGWGGSRLAGTVMSDVLSRESTPPGSPTAGNKHLITTGVGGWSGHDGEVATYVSGDPALELSWSYELLAAGKMVFVEDELEAYRTVGGGLWSPGDPKGWELDHWEGRTDAVGAFLGDATSLYDVELVVNDGVRDSLPVAALLNVYETNVPLGLTPDLSFIWNYLSDFWGAVDGREKAETYWSAVAQMCTDELMKLWQYGYSKSLLDIQRTFQRRWLNFDPWYEETNYDEDPAVIENAVDAAGYSDSPSPSGPDADAARVYVLNSALGTGDTITENTPSVGTATLDDSVGAFASWMVGGSITISGASALGNNGTFQITAVNSSTQLEFSNPSAVTVTEPFTYLSTNVPFGTSDAHYLVLDGVAYKIVRVNGANLVTSSALPTTARPGNWMIRPSVTSRTSNFSSLGVTAGDMAVFEIRDEDGALDDISAFVWGVRGKVLIFDDTNLSGYLASDTYTVRFRGVLRRSAIAVDDLVLSMPRLQEVIAPSRVEGAPAPLLENRDFRVEEVTTVEDETINSIQMLDSWFSQQLRGFSGYTDSSNHRYFYDASVDFEDTFGVDADLRDYVLELDGVKYRLYQVVSATQIELMDESLDVNLTGQKWWIRRIDDPPNHLWAEITHLDNRPTIDDNFGRLISFTLDDLEERTDNLDYLSAVQGLWYYVWGPKTPFHTRIGSQIILGLPFAEVDGYIIDIQSPFDDTRDRILIQDLDNDAIVRSYTFPSAVGVATNPDTGLPFSLGERVQQFAPLSGGVVVSDYLSDHEWYEPYIASGDFYAPQRVHTWGILINSDVFDLTNILFLVDYLRRYKPSYSDPFFVVTKALNNAFEVGDLGLFGPVVPDGYTYPDDWPAYAIATGWFDSPSEVPRAPITAYDPADPATWVTDPPVPLRSYDFGGLHLGDVPGSVPDGWENSDIPAAVLGSWAYAPLGPYQSSNHAATISEGTFIHDDTDESGRLIHKYGVDPTNLLDDGDFESGVAIGAPGSPWDELDLGGLGLTFSATKTGPACPLVLGSTKSLEINGVGTHHGISQAVDGLGDHPGPSTATLNFQVGARLYLYLISGQAYVRLLNQDNPQSVMAEWRHGSFHAQWHEIDLHEWRAPTQDTNYLTLQIFTGPAGGHFYVDGVGLYHKLMPWSQWGYDRPYGGRTGGYTTGGLPDDVCQIQIATVVP